MNDTAHEADMRLVSSRLKKFAEAYEMQDEITELIDTMNRTLSVLLDAPTDTYRVNGRVRGSTACEFSQHGMTIRWNVAWSTDVSVVLLARDASDAEDKFLGLMVNDLFARIVTDGWRGFKIEDSDVRVNPGEQATARRRVTLEASAQDIDGWDLVETVKEVTPR